MVSKCSQEGCLGHLDEFSDCLTEAVWQDSLRHAEQFTGTVEFDGSYALMIYEEAHSACLSDNGPTITIPAGSYIVHTNEQGSVTLLVFSTEIGAREMWEAADDAYSAWLDENRPEGIPPNAGSAD
jgi:hypothetical protein